MKEVSRPRRVGEQLRRELAELIRTEFSGRFAEQAHMNLVSITAVEVSRDLAHAKVFLTLVGPVEARAEVVAALNQAAPMLRGEIGRRLRLRSAPSLKFFYDESVERGAELSDLIDSVVAADAAKRRQEE